MMNKIYKVIWNAALQCWVAVSELGKAKGKTKSKKVLSAAAVMAVSAVGVSTNVEAAVNYATGTTFGNGMAIGSSSYANTNAAAYGHGANARALEDVAIGYKTISGAPVSGSTSHSSAQASVAVGTYANATHVATTAIGAHANAINNFATAVGAGALANKENGSAFGQGAMATGVYATALGKGALAKQDYSVALGKEAAANTQLTTSIGSKTNATGFSAIAIGSGHVPATGNTVIEDIQGAQATADDSMAVGASALANREGATALGKLSKATNNNAVAVGPDSVASGSWATATGASANASGQASAAFGESATASGKKSIATGSHASASGENAIASGKNAKALANDTIAIGADANATANAAGSLAIGRGSVVNATDATVVGPAAQANGANATAVGRGAAANGTESAALGRGATATGNQSVALGQGAQATVDSGVALGNGAVANRAARDRNTIVINTADPSKTAGLSDNNNGGDANTVYAPVRLVDAPGALEAIKNTINGNKGAVSVGDSGNTRQIINVAAGSADSDAVNVAQLKAVAGGIKRYSVTSPDGSITVTNPTPGSDPQNFQIKMNTTAVQDAAQWYVKEGTETSGTAVRGGNTVSFNDSSTVDVQHNNKNFTFNVKSGDVTANTNTGAITAPTDGNVLAKAKNVAEAIQRSGWELQANGTKVGLVNPGDKVNIKAGTGVTITPTNEANGISTLTISAAQQNYSWKLKEDSQTAAQALNVTNNTAVSLKGENYLNITNRNGGNFAFKTVTADVGMNTATGATNQATATGLTTNKAVADAIAKSGFQLKENGTLKNVVNPGESLNFKPGQGTTVSVGTNGDVQVNANVADIQAGNNVTVTKGNNGVVTINAKDTNTQASVANGTGLTLTESNNSNGTKKYTLGVNVDNNTIKVENGKLVANLSGVTDTNTQSTVEAKANNFVTVDGSTKNTNGTTKYQVGVTTGDVAVTEATGAVTAISAATGVATNKTVADAIAKSGFQLQENGTLRNVVNPGEILNFKPGKGTTVSVGKNGDVQINANVAGITAGKNISTTTDANGNVTINAKDTSAHVKAANNAAVKVDKAATTRTENNADITDYTVDLTDQTKTNITHGVNANETVTNKGLTFNGNTGSTGIKKLGSEVDVKGNTSNNVITTTANTNGITVDYNGTAAAQVTSLTYKANNANAKSVTLAKGLDFTNGTQTTAVVEDNGVVKFNVNTTTLSNATGNGNIQVPTGANSDGLVTAKNVANAINTSGWNLQANNASVGLINPSDKVSFDAGNGVTVTSTNEANGVSHIKVAAKVDGSTITVNDQGQLVANLSGAVNTQASVSNATSSPITIATTQNTNGTNNYTVDVNVDGKTITKEGGVLKAVIPSVETVTLTVNTTGNNAGKVGDVSTGDANKFVTGDNLAKTINATYWKASQGTHEENTSEETTGVASSEIKPGDELTFVSGKNMALKKNGNKFVYATKDDVVFNNVTANNTTTTNFTVKNGGNVDMGGNQVHNVSTGTAPTDAVNVKQLYDTVSGNVSTESVIKKADEDNIAEVSPKAGQTVGDKNATYEVSVSKAKIKALANETVKVNTSTAANNPITVTPHTENGNTTYTVNFDGAKAASEIPLTYKANDGAGKTVKLSEGLNFKNGTQTTAEVGDNGVVKFNVNTTTLSNTTANGKITVPDGNGLVTAKEVANAINAANWKLNVNGDNKQSVSAGDIVNFADGNGTTVTYKDGAVRVNANVTDVVSANGNATITRDPNTGIVTVNAKDTNTQASVKNGSGITVTPSTNANGTANYTVAVNVDGSTITVNNDGKLVANVPDTSKVSLTNNAGKVGDVSTGDANKFVTGDNLAKTINATYWKASQGTHEENTSEETTGAVSSEIKPGDELTFVSGKNMALKKDGNKFVYATKDDVTFNNVTTNNLTVKNGGNVDMGGNQVHNVANGTKGTDAVNLDQLNATTATANAGWVIKANGTNETTVKPNATVSLNNTDGNILITKSTTDNNVTFNFNPNATFGVVGKDGKDGVDGSIGVNGKDGASVVINGKDGSIGLTGPKGKDGVSVTLKPEKGTTTVNEKDANKEIERIKYTANGTTREVATLDDGLKFAGDDNAVINRTLGSLLNITGGAEKATVADNIRVTNDGKNGLKVQLSNNVTFNANGSVKVGDTTVNNGGLTITGGPSITKDGGVNAGDKVISNVSTGVKDNDAVNVKQLKDTVADSVSTESVIKKADEDNIAEVTVADNKQSGDKNAKYEVSVSKAKIKALANETVKVNTSTAANNPITVTSHTENGNTTYSVNFNGENASKVIPLSYKANDGEAKTVTLSEGLNFKNGTQTTAEVAANGVVKFNVNTTALSNVTNNGKITVPEGNGLVTAKEVAEAINASYWKANAGGNVDGATVTDNVTTGTEVFFAAGKNLKVKHSANNFTFSTADDVSFNNVTTNNLTVKNGGNVDMGGNQVHNVANGTKGTDAVNLDQLNATTATAKTEVKAGKNVSSVNESKDAKDGHTVYTIDAVDTSAHVKAAESNAAVKVEKAVTTRTDGNTTVTDYTVDLTDETKANITHGVNANTTVTTKGLTFNGNEGTTGIKKLGSEVDVKGGTANNVITTNATEAGITINYNGTEAAKVTHLTYKANGANAQSVNLTTGLDFTNGTQTTAEVAANGVVKFNVNTTALSNVTNNGKITVPEGNGLVTAKEVAEAINASYWKANAGGNVDGATVTDNVTTGTEVFFAAGKNLKVKHSANNFTFSTADDVSFNNVTTNNLTVKNGGNVDMGGNQVHNVANGTKGTDAVNLDQLNATTAIANAGWVIKANGTNATTVKPNATVSLNNTDGNILITKNTANNNVTFNFNPNATFGVVGKDGVDGSIGVNGKDGASVVIDGKNGSIGLTGPKGKDGKDGVSLTLKPEKGTTTVNAKDDGKEIERIKYTANGTTREVATLDDGLKFAGDDNKTINRTLGSLLNITGGATDSTTANNIRVTNDGKNGLRVQLANNVTFDANGSVKIGNTTVNNGGLTINGGPSITKDSGVNAGNKAISNVSTGVKDNDAVNVKQLKDSVSTESVVAKTGTDNIAEVSPKAGQTLGDKNAQYEVSVSKAKVKDAAVEAVKVNATTGSPITVTTTADAANNSTTYTVNFNGDNAAKEIPLTYKSNGNASTAKTVKLSDGLDFTNGTLTTAVVGDNGVVKFNVNQGAFNTTTADANGKLNNASKEGVSTVEDVIKAVNAAGWVVTSGNTSTGTVSGTSREVINPGDAVKFIAGQNVDITQDKGNFTIATRENVSFTTVTVGKDGKNGKDGLIGVNGTDGASVVINGKDGSIGLTGPKGADGKDGVSVTLKPEKGTTTVNAKDDGKEIERIKYTANGTTREVATLDDGLKFKGDSKQVINRTLGSQMNITGGADETTLTDNNIGVVYDKATDGLKVKLAKDVNLTSNGSVTIGNTTLSNNGFTITNKADPSKTVSVTDKGLNNGGNTIINVAPGVNGTDAVNLDQLNATTAIANAGWVIKANGTNATTVKPNATVSLNNTDGNILITKNKTDNNVTFNFNPNATFGVVGKDGKDGVDGSIGVNGKDGSSVVINGKDGSIGLNGKDGKNGLSIKGDQGPASVDGKDGETKTRIVYEYADPKDPNKTIRENVATLNDGLRFTGNNGVENAHRLNTLVTIVGEGVDKAASANFTSASGNINVKADGKGTLEVQLAKNLKNIETINNGNSTITLNKDGGTTISGGDVSVDGNKVTNVKDGDVSANSKDAVNGSQLYHVMTNATAGWNLSVNNGKDKGNVKPGAQVDLNNTDGNIIISKTANNVTFNFNPNATFGVKGKDGKDGVDGSIGVNGKDGASVVINGKDGSIGLTGPKGADGKDGASANMSVQKGTTTVNTDRDGGKDVTRIVYTDKDKDGKDIKREVATLDDGLKFKGDSEQVINRTLGSQMNITGGADSTKLTDNNIGVVYDEATNGLKVKLSKDVDLGKDGSITIGGTQVTNNGLTIKNGPSVTEKGVDAGNKKVTNVADGDINATSKDAVNGSQLYQAVNNINKNVNAAKTELEEGDNVTITSRVGNNGQTIYKVSSTDNSAHVQGGSDAVSVTKAETTRKDGSTTVTDYTVDLSSKTKDDIKKGVDAHDTVTNKGLTFNADKGTTGAKKLGSQVAVNGDNKNIETVADTNGVKVKLKDDINVNSVTANTFKAGDTIVNTKGVQVAAKDDRGNNTNVVINEKGINAGNTRIQNVAAGRADTDAVNVSQLKGAVTQIGNHINKMDKNLRAGIAGAMAAGGLYHATLPGKSMVAAGAGTYKGESAVAVGYSRLSDNGKVGIKFSVNTNTRGDSGAAASVGYQW